MPTRPADRFMPILRRAVLAGTARGRSDGQLLGAFIADRDADAFAGLVRRHGPMVLGVCRRVTGDHTTADDAFQAVFLVLARRAMAIKPREQVGNWLYGVAYRTAIKARMVLARRRSREKQVDVMPEPPVSPPAAWSDLQPVIDEELARLPDKLRLPVVLCDLEGRPQREVARHLGVPAATLATRLASARRTLAHRLTSRGVTLSGGALAGLLTAHGTVTAVPHNLAYGLAHAAEAVAGGNILTSLVSPHAIQLSEGVIRMMFLSKLKMIAVVLVTALTLSGGLGIGLVPAVAGSDPLPDTTQKSMSGTPAPAGNDLTKVNTELFKVVIDDRNLDAEVDDATFLRRLSLDLRGDVPTPIEMWFFVADPDAGKRAKVIAWMIDDETILAQLANKLGVQQDTIRLVRIAISRENRPVLLVAVTPNAGQKDQPARLYSLQRRERIEIEGDAPRTAEIAYFLGDPSDASKVNLWDNETEKHVMWTRKAIWEMRDVERGQQVGQGRRHARLKTNNDGESWYRSVKEGYFTWMDTASNGSAWVQVEGDKLTWFKPFIGQGVAVTDLDSDGQIDLFVALDAGTDSDTEFLKRVLLDVRGTAPTTLEEKYFAEDKDPRKREKLLDTLLKEPGVAKKLGDDWKKKMLETQSKPAQGQHQLRWRMFEPNGLLVFPKPNNSKTPQPSADPNKPGIEWRVIPANPNSPRPPADPTKPSVELHVVPANPKAPQPPADPAKPGIGWQVVPATPKPPQPPADPTKPVIELQVVPATPQAPQPPAPPRRVIIEEDVVRVPLDPRKPQQPGSPQPPAHQTTRLEKLVDELLAAKKTDAEMLEAVTLATVGRLPSDIEKRLTLGLVAKAQDRKGAWVEVAKAMTTEEGAKRGQAEVHVIPRATVVVPTPPAKK